MTEPNSFNQLSNPSEWTVIRFCVEISPDTSMATSVSITLLHRDGSEKTLIFSNPRFEQFGPLQIPQIDHIQIKSTSDRGWESTANLEVCELLEDQATLFWASSVRAHA